MASLCESLEVEPFAEGTSRVPALIQELETEFSRVCRALAEEVRPGP
ncbi:hypothetical protein BH23ACT12_BH23ACT12_01890 [soil metagenome]